MRDIKTILVTGGSGFIGWNFCNLILSNTDYHIINIDNLTYASKDKVYYIQNKKNYKFSKEIFVMNLELKRYLIIIKLMLSFILQLKPMLIIQLNKVISL